MTAIIVCPLEAVQAQVDAHGVRRVVSLLGPDTPHQDFGGIVQSEHLKLTFHDIIEPMPGFVPPREYDAELLLKFLEAWDRKDPILIHCWAGISRSTASAFTAMCMAKPGADEAELAWRLRDASPTATPNRLLVSFADKLLGREGRMVRAVDAIGRGQSAFAGVPFKLPL
jgi:predicted protein tyrosine phosphatase